MLRRLAPEPWAGPSSLSSLSPWDTALPGASMLTVAEDMCPGGSQGGQGMLQPESHTVYLTHSTLTRVSQTPPHGSGRESSRRGPHRAGGGGDGGGRRELEYSETSSNDYHVYDHLRTPGSICGRT